nr:retrovirus-related Pol polyprotein from transposon TNT 1-94 [Tanacetum cinerariifolium]
SSDNGKNVDEDSRQESECYDQEKLDNVNCTNSVNTASTNRFNAAGAITNNKLPFDLKMPELEDIRTFNFSNKDEDDDNRFHRGKIDKTLFIRRHKDDILLVQVYVDDIIFGSTKKELCNAQEKRLTSRVV